MFRIWRAGKSYYVRKLFRECRMSDKNHYVKYEGLNLLEFCFVPPGVVGRERLGVSDIRIACTAGKSLDSIPVGISFQLLGRNSPAISRMLYFLSLFKVSSPGHPLITCCSSCGALGAPLYAYMYIIIYIYRIPHKGNHWTFYAVKSLTNRRNCKSIILLGRTLFYFCIRQVKTKNLR